MSSTGERWVKNWLVGASLVLLGQCLVIGIVMVKDHFALAQVRKEMAEVKPRVEWLYWTERARQKSLSEQ